MARLCGCCYFYEFYLNMNDYEITKLKKELQRKQELLKEEKEDHRLTQDHLVKIQAERDRFYSELIINRQTIEKVEVIMAEKIKEIKAKLEQQNSESLNELQKFRNKLEEQNLLRDKLTDEAKHKDTVISDLTLRLKELSRKYKDPSFLVNVKQLGEQAQVSHTNMRKITEKYNKVCSDMQNIMAENKILRKLHGVPENFGFDLEQIKIAEKQELEDYKAQCRKLQSQIEQLEEQRTQLRYRLRQFNALYSNKGQRYKDLTNKQLQLLDQYALNLKEGKVQLPQIDKTHKEMEMEIIKLRNMNEILRDKSPQIIQKPQVQDNANQDRLSIEALRKLQDQFVKLINPLRDDLKKITDLGGRPQDMARYQGQGSHYRGDNISEGTQFRPPMPLPIAHNDWSNIKDGFSYLYNSKIPINLKDVSDEASFSIAKAKYEIAALQLQNIESLKLLKEKQGIENKLTKEVDDLRDKYQKCVRVQDELFLRYFKEKQQGNQKVRKLEVDRNNIENQKLQLQTNLNTLTVSFNALTKKTDLEKRCAELTSRLAIADADLLKLKRKYQILNEEHKILRTSYSSLQAKSATSEWNLKQKLAYSKKTQKELTFYLKKVLDQSKDAVGGDVHRSILNRIQILNDRSVSNSIKETQLRLRINQLENIERQINLKDDIIETLRDDNFDLMLELQIVKNRLESTDGDYRQFQQVFRRLTSFINQNNISLSTYFKKFDKDGSGQLNKNEFISAIKAIGFDINNQQFELLFAQFDLDGSQSVTYREFLRKMRRSGVLTRNSEQQALYRLFKAIKQANISVRKAFQIIDMDGSNEVSKVEMDTAFRKIGIDISMNTIEYIFKICDDDGNGTISCIEFQKLFDDIIRQSAIEQKEMVGNDMDWKLLFVIKMQEISEKYHKGGLKETFNSFDDDGSSCITINQLTDFFKKAGVDLARKDLLELFQFLDRHRDGKVEYIQFLKVLEEAKQEKKRVDRMKYIKTRTQELRKQSQGNIKQASSKAISQEKTLNVKLMALESKHTSLIKKNQKLIKTVVTREQQNLEMKKELEQLEKNVEQIRAEFYKEKENNIRFEQKIRNRVSQEQSKKLVTQSKKLEVQAEDLRNNLELYKKLYEDLSTKNRYEEMRVVKIESEVQKYYQIVKDLQGLSDINAELGKTVYELQISKRNQQIIGKKFEQASEEVRIIQSENLKLTDESLQKEREIMNAHFFFQEKGQLMQRTIDELNSRILPTLNPKKVQQILLKIRQISTSKTQLQKENRQLCELNFNLQVRNDYIENEKVHLEELQKRLRRNYTDQTSVAIIDLTKKLSQYKMAELKSKRECGLLKEKEEYYLRVNNTQTENIKDIEVQLADWEKKYSEREEFWRKRLSDQIKLMEDIQKEASKTKEEQRNAQRFFQEQTRQDRAVEQKFDALPQQKQTKLSSIMRRSNPSGNENAVFQLKAKIQELQEELMAKQRQIFQLKTTFREIVPEANKHMDFSGQMNVSMVSMDMQTNLTTSQLRNNARRFINNQKQQEEYYKEQAQKISQAAQQSIQTLQRMIDDKNDQIKRKEQIIESLKKDFLKNKEEDCRQIQMMNEEIRQLKTKVQTNSLNQIMMRPTNKNFYPSSKSEDTQELRNQLQRREEENRLLQEKYDKLFISKQKKNQEQSAGNQRLLERKLDDLQGEREAEKKRYLENEERLNQKIKNLQKLSKEKDGKLAKLQKTLIDLKDMAVNEAVKGEGNEELQQQMREAITNMNKGKTANDSKMEIVMQKSLQAMQVLSKKNKEYEQELRRQREQKLSRTTFKK